MSVEFIQSLNYQKNPVKCNSIVPYYCFFEWVLKGFENSTLCVWCRKLMDWGGHHNSVYNLVVPILPTRDYKNAHITLVP